MKSIKKILALVLAGTMLAGCLVGCSKDESASAPLVIASADMSEKFSPFFADSTYDQNVVDFTQVALLGNTRAGEIVYKGIEGETYEYNGTDYKYTGIADCEVKENADGTVDYTFKIRDDLKFSDGEAITADDVIFSYYVFADPTFDGAASLFSLPILGMTEYRSGMEVLAEMLIAAGKDNTDFTYWDEETQTKFWTDFEEKAIPAFVDEIIAYCVSAGYPDVTTPAGAGELWGYEGLPADATAMDLFNAMLPNYDNDIALTLETETAAGSITTWLPEYATAIKTGESADSIKGIEKVDEYTVKVTLTEADATAIYSLAIPVAPLHYYGSDDAYDYDNNKFGFTKGDLSGVKSKTTTPLGAGPYKFVKYENKVVYLEANENYYKGEPKIKNIQIKTTLEADNLPGVVQGTVDISEPAISKEVMANIKNENKNGELTGDKLATTLVDFNGYGYVGMNSNNVSVGNDGSSEASKNLRKAIATVISVYRDVAIDSYYGEAASVINYPISNTSWAAPQKSDSSYAVAFSKDVEGNPIYTDGMSDDEKYAAALDAAVGYFKAAGYTFDASGKITAAPEGAKTSYELIIPASGTGDHPSFTLVTQASEALKTIGFDLKITDVADGNILWDGLDAETIEIWCAAWGATLDPDMFQIYHSEGGSAHYYAIRQAELDKMVLDGRVTSDQSARKAIYKEALDYIVDYAVEIPIYQRQECYLFSSERVNMDTVAKDQTSYYSWMNEIETMEMN